MRKYYLDNLRWISLSFVILYHVFYIFNSSWVIWNMEVSGIKELDSVCVFIYPWIMCLLFAISWVSARYSLQKRINKEFLRDRFKRIFIPCIVWIFAYGWIVGLVTDYYGNIFAESPETPRFIKYIILSLIWSWPLWYGQALFVISLVFILIKKIDKKQKIDLLFSKINLPILFLLVILVWLASQILNTPVITVYRWWIYLTMFLFWYYIFSNDKIIKKLEKISISLWLFSLSFGIIFTIKNFWTNFSSNEFLTNIFTNIYVWLVILSAFWLAKKFLNFENIFTKYMHKNNFSFYVLHYTLQIVIAFILVEYFKFDNLVYNYILLIIWTIIFLPIITEIFKRIPVVNRLLLWINKK